ncbi:hypothetical protein GUJ93_ZPchr0438g28951 [Zizania palustris]|uniref:Uncharacterized protein n=1 Tax=Zizania palustris TaxID=103762 RepID=A0A8J5UW18_ZIZPA|nr:hypothetical protein GUJ93_ZPchr0438g28951 [Zizania palustris]
MASSRYINIEKTATSVLGTSCIDPKFHLLQLGPEEIRYGEELELIRPRLRSGRHSNVHQHSHRIDRSARSRKEGKQEAAVVLFS